MDPKHINIKGLYYTPHTGTSSIEVKIKQIFGHKTVNIFYPLVKTFVWGPQKNHLNETNFVSTYNMFCLRNKKN